MYKINIIHQLPIPNVVSNIICSFLFYTVEQSIEYHKQKYNEIVKDIRRTTIIYKFSQGYMNRLESTIYVVNNNHAHPFGFRIRICNECRNYIKKQIQRTVLFVCQCK